MNIYALGGLSSGFYQGQDDRLRRQALEMQLANAQAQQQAPQAWLDAMRQYRALNPDQPAATAPMPGQASQPAPQLPPPQMPQMQPPSPAFRGPMPQQQGPAPYQPVPTSPQGAAQPQGAPSVPAPPRTQAGPRKMPDMYEMADILQKQGITGPRLLYALNYHQGLMSAEGKQQLAELQQQLRMQQAETAALRAQSGLLQSQVRQDAERRLEGMVAPKTDLMAAQAEAARARAQSILNKAASGGGGKSGGGATISDEDARFLGELRAKGDPSALSGLGWGKLGAANRAKVTKYWREATAGSGADAAAADAEFFGTKAGERTAGTRAANVGLAVSEAKKFADLALEASAGVPRTEFPNINRMQLAMQKGAGSPAVARFIAAHNSLINAYARAVSPTGAPTVSDKEHARDVLDTAYSKGQYQAAIDQLQKEMAAAQAAPAEVRSELRGAVGATGDGKVVDWSTLK